MTHPSLFLPVAFVICVLTTALGQTDPVAGMMPFSTRAGSGFDSVDLATSNILLSLPVRTKNQKIPFSFALYGNSHAFTYPIPVQPPGQTQWDVFSTIFGGESLGVQTTSSTRTKTCNGKTNDTESYNFVVIDVSGAVHPLPANVKVDNDNCDPLPVTGVTTDGSGYTMQIAPGTGGLVNFYVWNRSGVQVFNNFTGVVTDPDGVTQTYNKNTGIYTDSLGTQAMKAVAGSNGTPDSYTYTGGDGSTTDGATVSYTNYHQKTVFGCNSTMHDLDGAAYLPSSVSIKGVGTISITYESAPGYVGQKDSNGLSYVTGRIKTLTYPLGGLVTYGYSGGNNGVNCTSKVVSNSDAYS
jgi:hypothetical protein